MPLSAQKLGDAGEALFDSLCARASDLTSNQSNRDRRGWDFVVDLPVSGHGPLDHQLPASCRVQIKATRRRTGRISMKLSAARDLALEAGPAAVVVFRLTAEGEGREGYLLPMIGAVLGRILQKLREAEAAGREDIHRIDFTVDPEGEGARFELSPIGLRDALSALCGEDRDEYIAEKRRQIASLGYDEDGAFLAEARVWIEDAEQLSDIVMGLRPMRPDQVEAYDVRFGIPIPHPAVAPEDLQELWIEPDRVGPCMVAFRGAALQPAALFEAEMVAGLPYDAGLGRWMLIRHADFHIRMGQGHADFGTEGFHNRASGVADWIRILRALAHLAGGNGGIAITPKSDGAQTLELPVAGGLTGPRTEMFPRWLEALETWSSLAAQAGVSTESPFTFDEMLSAADVGRAVAFCRPGAPGVVLAFDAGQWAEGVGDVDAIYINSARLADARISYAVKVTLSARGAPTGEMRSTCFELMDVRPEVRDLQVYAERMAGPAGIRVIIHPNNVAEEPGPI